MSRARGGPGLVSAKEARDLQALLDMFAMGYSDVEEFQQRLDSELGALEVGFWHLDLGFICHVCQTQGRPGAAGGGFGSSELAVMEPDSGEAILRGHLQSARC